MASSDLSIEFQPHPKHKRFRDLSGNRFGRWTVLGYVGGRYYKWLCACDCGKTAEVRPDTLLTGISQSCGCFSAEQSSIRGTTHGYSDTPTFRSWKSMKERCTNPNATSFSVYGGRGIRVCERWLSSFEAFLADMGERPEGHTLDRENNDGNYEPGNCRWATYSEQLRNTTRNHFLTYRGRTKPMVEWAAELHIDYQTLASRFKAGWSVERAFSEPSRVRPS